MQDGVDQFSHNQDSQEGGLDQQALHALQEAWGGHSEAITQVTVIVLIKMALQPRVMGVQVGLRRKRSAKA